MFSSRVVPVLIAISVGVGTGVYVFQPLLKEYEAETKGTWILPNDETRVNALLEKRQQENDSSKTDTEKQFPVSSK